MGADSAAVSGKAKEREVESMEHSCLLFGVVARGLERTGHASAAMVAANDFPAVTPSHVARVKDVCRLPSFIRRPLAGTLAR
jgi:hypothetical protein